jgi:predicted phosphodiesterase
LPPKAPQDDLKRVLFVPDTHTPYHDARAVRLLLEQVVPAFVWDTVCVLGDFFDNYGISRFSKNPTRLKGVKKELQVGFGLIERIEAITSQRRIFIEGNHEQRLHRFLQEKAPEFYEIVLEWWQNHFRPPAWEYVPYMEDTSIGRAFVTHDVGRCGEHSTKQSLHDYQDNVVVGHNHLMDYSIRGNAKGTAHVGASFGWLGDVQQIDYRHRMKCRRDWQLGFGVGYVRSNGFIYIQPVPIVGYTCVVEGRLFRG